MGDRPILFSAPMVRALLAGTKTQTRRIAKARRGTTLADFTVNAGQVGIATKWELPLDKLAIPHAVGSRLWVRESGHLLREAFDHGPRSGEDVWRDAGFCHAADGAIVPARAYDPPLSEWAGDCGRISRPSIHMPRWASRLTLTVTDVRIERLQDISATDAIEEGLAPAGIAGWAVPELGDDRANLDPVAVYRELWDHINGAGSWAANPWVVAYSFAVARRNIDAEG